MMRGERSLDGPHETPIKHCECGDRLEREGLLDDSLKTPISSLGHASGPTTPKWSQEWAMQYTNLDTTTTVPIRFKPTGSTPSPSHNPQHLHRPKMVSAPSAGPNPQYSSPRLHRASLRSPGGQLVIGGWQLPYRSMCGRMGEGRLIRWMGDIGCGGDGIDSLYNLMSMLSVYQHH